MTSIADIYPVQNPSREALIEAAREQEVTSLWQLTKDAASTEWVAGWALRQVSRGVAVDPDFQLTDERLRDLTAGLPDHYISEFDDVESLTEARVLSYNLHDVHDRRERLAAAGFTGAALTIGATLFDPALIAGGAAGSAARIPRLIGAAGKADRLRSIAAAGFLAGAGTAPVEGYIATQDPDRGADDVLYSTAFATVLGGGFRWAGLRLGDFADSAMVDAAERARRDMLFKEFLGMRDGMRGSSPVRLTPEGAEFFREQIAAHAEGRSIEHITDLLHERTRAEFTDLLRTAPGALPTPRHPAPQPVRSAPRDVYEAARVPDIPPAQDTNPVISRLRFSIGGQLARSPQASIRRLGAMLGESSIVRGDGEITAESAYEWATRQANIRMARFYRVMGPEYKAWRKRKGVKRSDRVASRQEFNTEVARAVRRPPGTYTNDPNVNRVADHIRQAQADILRLAHRNKVKGFESVVENPTYLMRVHNLGKIDGLIADLGDEGFDVLAGFYARAIMSGSEDITEEAAERIANGYLRNLRDLEWRRSITHSTPAAERDHLEEVLRDVLGDDFDEEQMLDILYGLNRNRLKDADRNRLPRAKRRVSIDESYAETITLADGETIDLSIEDLLVNDAESLFGIYTRQMTGGSAMQNILDNLTDDPDNPILSFGQVIERLRKEAGEAGRAKAFAEEEQSLQIMYRGVMGMRRSAETAWTSRLEIMRDLQYLQVANQFGWAQLAEVGQLLSHGSFRAMYRQMPALRAMFKKAADGQLDNHLLRELEGIWALGTDDLRHQAVHRFDADASVHTFGGGKLRQYMQEGRRFTSTISGLSGVNTALQRAAGLAFTQRFAQIARGRGSFSARRLQHLGMTDRDVQRISEQIRAHAEFRGGRTLIRLNVDRWDDQTAAARFIAAGDRWARRAVQQNSPAELSQWMSSDLGRTFIQFRGFVISAWEKQLLHGLSVRDAETFTAFALTSFFGALAYIGQTYTNSLGREDAAEWRRERLSNWNIAKAGFQRGGWSSLLPVAYDTVAMFSPLTPQFQYTRTSGLSTSIAGNPTADFLFTRLPRAGEAITNIPASLVTDEETLSGDDFDAITKLLPFSNAMGIRNILQAIERELPDEEDEE